MALPARGRSVLGPWAATILSETLPAVVHAALYYESTPPPALLAHLNSVEDQSSGRSQLEGLGLVAFVGDGAVLPRRSGASDLPMEIAVPFASPPELRVTLQLPHRGAVSGMGIRKGVSLIVGGGFHGKSTLLEALQFGVYNKVVGDGRELVMISDTAAKVRPCRALHGPRMPRSWGEPAAPLRRLRPPRPPPKRPPCTLPAHPLHTPCTLPTTRAGACRGWSGRKWLRHLPFHR